MNAGELRQKELNYVETPLMAQLAALGWDTIALDESTRNNPAASFRTSLAEVVIERELKAAILRINPWVTDTQANDLVLQMRSYSYPGKLLENNIEVFDRITQGLFCDDEITGETNRPVRLIDYADVEGFNKETDRKSVV